VSFVANVFAIPTARSWIGGPDPQRLNYLADFIFLKQPDAGDPSCASFEARAGIFQGNATERKDWDFVEARLAQSVKTGGTSVWRIFLLPNRSKDGEVGSLGGGTGNVGWRVAGDTDHSVGTPAPRTLIPDLLHFGRRDVVGAQMHSVCADDQSNIRAGVDEKASF